MKNVPMLGFLLVVGACASGPKPNANSATSRAIPETNSTAVTGSAGAPTVVQLKGLLGHYSTEDKRDGFVLDRTGNLPKVRLDRTSRVVTLQVNDGPLDTKEYSGEDIWIRVDASSGDVRLFEGPNQHEGVRVVRDADAERL